MLRINIEEHHEKVHECLQELLRSFAYTQIGYFKIQGYTIHSKIKDHDSHSNQWGDFWEVCPCSNFFEELKFAVSRTKTRIEIYNLKLSSKEFIQLVKAAKKAKYLTFFECKISFDSEFDFGPMEGCLIEKIYIFFYILGCDEGSENEECLIKIFWGILNCTDLIRSLKDLDFGNNYSLNKQLKEKAIEKFGEEYLEIMPYLMNY